MTYMFKKEISSICGTEVLVCGGGCAGVIAAIAASRTGAKTMLIEKNYAIGGTATIGLVGPFMLSFDGKGDRQIIKGIFDEMVTRLEEKGGAIHPAKVGDGSPHACYYKGYDHRHNNVTPFDSDMLQLVMFEMLKEAGVEILLNTVVVDTIVEGNTLKGIVAYDGNNLRVYNSKVCIDCTGDGLVSFKAGAAFEKDDQLQPMTLFFSIYGVDEKTIEEYIEKYPEERGMLFNSYIEKARLEAKFPIPRNKVGLYKCVNDGEWKVNTTRVQNCDATIPEELTEAYIKGLEQVFFLMDFFKGLPGLENAKLKQVAQMMGIRETRRLKGEYTLTADDAVNATNFEDTIALCSFLLDIHPAQGNNAGIQHEKAMVANYFKIPYRVLVPEKIDGLLVAGRCVSATHEAMASIRVMPPVFAMGHAAGVAAAMAVKSECEPRNIDVNQLQKTLVEQGAIIK